MADRHDRETPPPQHQSRQPGAETAMHPRPQFQAAERRGSGRLDGRRALITGGDSGIGRAVAVAFAREGADVAIAHLDEDEDARETARAVERRDARCVVLRGDLGERGVPERLVAEAADALGGLDLVVSNAAEQHVVERIEDLDLDVVARTFRTNVLGPIALLRAAMPHLAQAAEHGDASIVVTTSVTAFHGQPVLVDYAATKGALVGLVRSLALQVAERGVRVNAVAPGPIWTPLIPASFEADQVEDFGGTVPLGRPGQPEEVAESFVFLASTDASYMTGQVLHPNGGKVVGG